MSSTKNLRFPSPRISLGKQIAELCVLERCLIEALDVQQFEPGLRENPAAEDVVNRIRDVLHEHTANLDTLAASHPAIRNELRASGTAMAGLFVGFFCKMRARDVPTLLRNDWILLNLAAMSYTALHATALALGDEAVAGLALKHLRQFAPLVQEITRLMPALVVEDLARRVAGLKQEAGQAASANTQSAWEAAVPATAGAYLSA